MCIVDIVLICFGALSLFLNLLGIFLYIFLKKRADKVKKLEQKKKKQELKSVYKAGLKALKGIKKETDELDQLVEAIDGGR